MSTETHKLLLGALIDADINTTNDTIETFHVKLVTAGPKEEAHKKYYKEEALVQYVLNTYTRMAEQFIADHGKNCREGKTCRVLDMHKKILAMIEIQNL